MQSGNIYRIRADGSHLEYFAHGQVNPFGLAFDPLGNLYSCDCDTKPIWQLLRGGYYPSFGKPDDGLGFAPTVVDHYHDSTAIAGIAYYAADKFPEGPPRQRLRRRRGHQPRQRVPPDLERHDADCDEAGFPAQRRPLVPAGASQARAGRRALHRRFL